MARNIMGLLYNPVDKFLLAYTQSRLVQHSFPLLDYLKKVNGFCTAGNPITIFTGHSLTRYLSGVTVVPSLIESVPYLPGVVCSMVQPTAGHCLGQTPIGRSQPRVRGTSDTNLNQMDLFSYLKCWFRTANGSVTSSIQALEDRFILGSTSKLKSWEETT